MIRKIVKIDAEKCNGCGACAKACLEDAIGIIYGKAVLLRDDYCDGLGNCLPVCPMDAIGYEEREAAAFDEEAVKRNQEMKKQQQNFGASCSGIQMQSFARPAANFSAGSASSELRQWPVQIKLAPLTAPYFDNANLLIAADCSAYAYGNFHAEFIRNFAWCTRFPIQHFDKDFFGLFAVDSIFRNHINQFSQVGWCDNAHFIHNA